MTAKRLPRLFLFSLILLLITGTATAGCSGEQKGEHDHEMAPLSEMPVEAQAAPVAVQEAFQFATANAEVLQKIPCYCGCGAMGHRSNYDCYISGIDRAGNLVYDDHAYGCSICIDITQDVMRLLDEGKSVPQIYAIVDETYSRFGPPTVLQG